MHLPTIHYSWSHYPISIFPLPPLHLLISCLFHIHPSIHGQSISHPSIHPFTYLSFICTLPSMIHSSVHLYTHPPTIHPSNHSSFVYCLLITINVLASCTSMVCQMLISFSGPLGSHFFFFRSKFSRTQHSHQESRMAPLASIVSSQ